MFLTNFDLKSDSLDRPSGQVVAGDRLAAGSEKIEKCLLRYPFDRICPRDCVKIIPAICDKIECFTCIWTNVHTIYTCPGTIGHGMNKCPWLWTILHGMESYKMTTDLSVNLLYALFLAKVSTRFRFVF